jgi:hypothetical protein
MKRLVLTSSDGGAGALKGAGLADCVIAVEPRFAWGPLPSPSELERWLASRSAADDARGSHWLDNLRGKPVEEAQSHGLGLVEFCSGFDAIDLWIDPKPNAQLILIWLLDYFRSHQSIVSKLNLVQAGAPIGNHPSEEVAGWRILAIKIRNGHLEIADLAWQAYRAPTPRAWFDLLAMDLSALPSLRQAVVMLLEELPMLGSGLGATEMRMLELIAEGNACPPDVFPGHEKRNKRSVFGYWEIGALLDALARGPAPVVSGLDEGPFASEMLDDRDRHARYKQTRLSLTELGQAVLAGREDFSRHNPVHRWWGGTELTNDRLWRWDPAKQALVAP